MGKQIRFIMHPDDEYKFLEYLNSKSSLKFILDYSNTENLIIDISDLISYSPKVAIYIFDTNIGIAPAYISKKNKKFSDGENDKSNSEGYYFKLTDAINAPIINYMRSISLPDNNISEGRIWAEMKAVANGQLIMKDDRFIMLFDEIATWLKRHMHYDSKSKYYLSSKAEEWLVNSK